jgi:hypothetical protein
MIANFQKRETFVPSLLLNTHDPHLMDLLYKFVDCDITHQWLFEADLVTRLVALLHHEETIEVCTFSLQLKIFLNYEFLLILKLLF